ncbi:MAG: nucleotidyltransferase domain-containing protein [Spirochaetota bacterium]
MKFDPAPYAAGIRELNRRESERIESRLELARVESGRLAAAIVAADPAVRRVFLFGSVANGRPSREDFDIDLAIDGGDAYAAMEVVETSAFDVDIVELGLLPPAARELVLERGQLLAIQGPAQ